VAVFSMNFPKSFKAAVDNIRNHLSTNDVTRRRSEVGHRSNDLLNLENWARTLARIILDRKNTKVGKIAAQRCLDQLDSLNDPPLRCLDQLDSLNNPPDKPGNHFHHPHQSLSDDDDIMTNQELPKDDDIMTNQELPKDDDRVKDDPQLDADEDADMSSQPKPLGNLQANQIILQSLDSLSIETVLTVLTHSWHIIAVVTQGLCLSLGVGWEGALIPPSYPFTHQAAGPFLDKILSYVNQIGVCYERIVGGGGGAAFEQDLCTLSDLLNNLKLELDIRPHVEWTDTPTLSPTQLATFFIQEREKAMSGFNQLLQFKTNLQNCKSVGQL